MSAVVLRFPHQPVCVLPARDGGWLVVWRACGWLHGSRNAAIADAHAIAAAHNVNFTIGTTRRFGAPTEPIVVRQQHKEKDMAFQQKFNRGSLFRNGEKCKEEDRDYAGSINVEGREFWLSGWLSETRKGSKYLSLSIKPKDEQEKSKLKASPQKEPNDAILF